MNLIKQAIRSFFDKLGLEIKRVDKSFFTLDENFKEIYEFCRPFTMTSLERMYALYKATEYLVKNNVPGDVIECLLFRLHKVAGCIAMLCKQAVRKVTDVLQYCCSPFLHVPYRSTRPGGR